MDCGAAPFFSYATVSSLSFDGDGPFLSVPLAVPASKSPSLSMMPSSDGSSGRGFQRCFFQVASPYNQAYARKTAASVIPAIPPAESPSEVVSSSPPLLSSGEVTTALMEGTLDGAREMVGAMVVSCGVGAGIGVVAVGCLVDGDTATGGSVSALDGAFVGEMVGSGTINADGSLVVVTEVGTEEDEGMITGDAVGCPTGVEVTTGEMVGVTAGVAVGDAIGEDVGLSIGEVVGLFTGDDVGLSIGEVVGDSIGDVVGLVTGDDVGLSMGEAVGLVTGDNVGLVAGETVGTPPGTLVGPATASCSIA